MAVNQSILTDFEEIWFAAFEWTSFALVKFQLGCKGQRPEGYKAKGQKFKKFAGVFLTKPRPSEVVSHQLSS